MSVVPASIIAPIREEFLASLPDREDTRPLGCHNPRIPDGIVFDRVVLALVSGMGRTPVDRGEQGLKRSQLTDGYGEYPWSPSGWRPRA